MTPTLRPWRMDDAPALAAMLDNPRVQAQLRDLPFPYTLADAEEYITAMQGAPSGQVWACAIDAGGRAVGSIAAIRKDNIHARTAEIGYYIAEPCWRKGYGTSAVRQLAAFLMATSDLLRLSAEVFAANTASCRVLEKAGFSCEGIMCAHAVKNGHVMDMKMYALIRSGSCANTMLNRQ